MSDRIKAWLDESQRLADEAAEGPWGHWPEAGTIEITADNHTTVICNAVRPQGGWGTPIYQGGTEPTAEFIAKSRTRFPQAVSALRAIMELHRPVTVYAAEVDCPDSGDHVHVNDWHEENVSIGGEWYCKQMPLYRACAECEKRYPCPTARDVAGALDLEGDDDE